MTGDATAQLGDATLNAQATDGEITGTFAAPNGVLNLAQPITADFTATRSQGQVTLTDFEASLPQRDLSLGLSGPAWPNTALTGTLQTGALPEPVKLGLTRSDGYTLVLQEGDLDLLATLSPGFALQSLAAQGTLALAGADLRSDLLWRPETGFSGAARASLAQGKTDAVLTLSGEGKLNASGEVSYSGQQVAQLDAALSRVPWRDQSVTGRVGVNAPLSELSPTWLGEPLSLEGTLDLSGSLSQPDLSGPVALSGALSAAGTLRASRSGAALNLRGENLMLEAQATAQGWQVETDADALSLKDLIPQLTAPRLTAQLRGAGAWGETPNIRANTLLLETAQSRVSGSLDYDGSLFAPLDLRLNLADVGLRGEVTGPLLIGSATSLEGIPLSSGLVVRDVGPKGAPWGLSGGLDIGGTLSSPIVETRLMGVGSAQGALSARLEPGRYAALTSDLALGPVTSDLRLRWRLGELEAQGTVAYADYALSLDAARSGTKNVLQLRGSEKLAAWRGLLSGEGAQLTGDLSSLSPQLGGALNLAASWRPEVVVAGTLTGLEAGTLELGDLTLGSENGGSEDGGTEGAGGLERLILQGDLLTASLALKDTPSWTLSRLELPLPSGLALRAQGQGTAQQGALNATLSGSALGEALDVPLALNYDAGTFSVQSQVDLFSGSLNLDARYAPGFQRLVRSGRTRQCRPARGFG